MMETAEEYQERRGKEEFAFFLALMWLFLGLPMPTKAQIAFAEYLQYGPERKVVMAFRGVGKSWVTAAYVIWCLWRNPQEKVLVVSASRDRALAFSIFVKRVIAEWDLIKELRPRKNSRDSNENFDVGPALPAQAPSVKCVGIKSQFTGTRAHRIVFDDVEVPNNSETVSMREKLGELVKEAASVLVPDEEDVSILYLGTPQTEDTIYAKLPERGYDVRIWPARYPSPEIMEAYSGFGAKLFDSLQAIMDSGDFTVNEPTDSRFDEEDLLEREREYGPIGWQLQFMLNPRMSDAERYPLKLRDLVIGSFDAEYAPNKIVWSGDAEYTAEDLPSVGMAGDRFQRRMVLKDEAGQEIGGYAPLSRGLLMVDPSGRGKDETSWTVTKVLNGQVFLVGEGGFRGDGYSDAVLTKLANLYVKYDCQYVRVEANFGDGMFTKLFSPIFKKVTGRGLDPDKVDFKNQTISKEKRIIDTLEPVMSAHKLVVDESVVRDDYQIVDPTTPPNERIHRMLFHQITRVTRERGALKFDDRLDNLAMAVGFWMGRLGKDVDEEVRKRKEQALDEELARFVAGFKQSSTGPGRRPGRRGGTLGRRGMIDSY